MYICAAMFRVKDVLKPPYSKEYYCLNSIFPCFKNNKIKAKRFWRRKTAERNLLNYRWLIKRPEMEDYELIVATIETTRGKIIGRYTMEELDNVYSRYNNTKR